MFIDGQITLQLAQERIEEALRAAEQQRAIRAGQPQRSLRDRVGSALVWLGHWRQD